MKTLRLPIVLFRIVAVGLIYIENFATFMSGARRLNFAGRPIYIPEIQRATMIIARGDSAQIFSSSLSKVI